MKFNLGHWFFRHPVAMWSVFGMWAASWLWLCVFFLFLYER